MASSKEWSLRGGYETCCRIDHTYYDKLVEIDKKDLPLYISGDYVSTELSDLLKNSRGPDE